MTRAATALRLSQSAVGSAIRALEDRHAVRRLDRIARRGVPTEAGRLFLDDARAVLAGAEVAGLRPAECGGRVAGPLRVEASRTVGTHGLPPQLVMFPTRRPDVEIRLGIGDTADVATAAAVGLAEAGRHRRHAPAPVGKPTRST